MASDIDFITKNKTSGNQEFDIFTFFGEALIFVMWGLFILFLVWLIANLVRLGIYFWKHKAGKQDMVFLQISLPKIANEDSDRELGRRQENEIISVSENIYQVISYYSRSYFFSDWFLGSPSFSFEIIKSDNKINFYAGCQRGYVETIQKQIISTFAKCKMTILEKLPFFENKIGAAVEIVQKKNMEMPFRTYTMMTGDPMNNLINALELAKDDETVAFQMIISPISNWWQAKGRNAAHKIQNEKDKTKLAVQTGAHNPNNFEKPAEDQNMGGMLTPNQQNIVKRLE